MIKIEITLNTEQELAMSILKITEQKVSNQMQQTCFAILDDMVNRAKRKKVRNKTLMELEND